MAKVNFSITVTKKIVPKEEIRKSLIGSKEMAKEMRKVMQAANRRAQNIEKAGLVSPAYQTYISLQGREGSYSKFSITGKDITNETDWERAKMEYAQAISFMNSPTSTARGARQYVKGLAKEYEVEEEVALEILKKGTSSDFIGDKLPALYYTSMIHEYMDDYKTEESTQRSKTDDGKNRIEKALDKNVNDIHEELHKTADFLADTMLRGFKVD